MHVLPRPLARLCLSCPDQPGIIAAVTGFLHQHGANITELGQHSTDPEGGTLLMRLEFLSSHLTLPESDLNAAFGREVAPRFGMSWRFAFASRRKTVAVLASTQEHALLELLWRGSRQQLNGEIAMVISNHRQHQQAVTAFGIPFHHVPISAETKDQAEAQLLQLAAGIDLLVLARYMQILSPRVVAQFPNRIINIHHSFLPAFVGAQPYKQAYEQGVKLIGATAHYVTEQLDQGPIIEQDVIRVTHAQDVSTLIEQGRDIERNVLARAVKWHLEDRILVHGNKTIIFA